MSQIFPLEEFQASCLFVPNGGAGKTSQPLVDPEELESQKVLSYDTGYSAGWEDAAAALAEEHVHIGTELAKNLQAPEFTFHEARVQIMKTLEPLLSEIVAKILPRLVSESISQTVVEELLQFAETVIDSPIEIVVAPQNLAALEHLLSTVQAVPAKLVEEPTLGTGQVQFRAGQSEKQINLDDAIERIGSAIHSIYHINEREISYG